MVTDLYQLPFQNLDDIIAKAEKGERLSPRELKDILSRTFGPNIDLLAFSRGKNEAPKAEFVTNLNNNARFADVIEDGKLSRTAKLNAHRKLTHIYNRIDIKEEDVEQLIAKDLSIIVEEAKKGALDKKEKIYIEQFAYGDTLRDLRSFKPSIKNSIVTSMNKMMNGMGVYLNKGKIETSKELTDYCFFVAGTIGDALNNIVRIEDKENISYNNARALAAYFQITNITRGLEDDHRWKDCRIKFLPDEFHEGISHDALFTESGKEVVDARKNVLEKLLETADEYFTPASQYVIDIPRKLSGYLAFCGVPLILSKENQKVMARAGAERVFKGEREAIKINRNVLENAILFVYNTVNKDDGIPFIAWLNDYRKNPNKYSFDSDEYKKWSPSLF